MEALRSGNNDRLGCDDHAELDFRIFGLVLDVVQGTVFIIGILLLVHDLEFGLSEQVDVLGCWNDSD